MTVTVNAKALHGALMRVMAAIKPTKNHPVLQCVHISAAGETMRIEATDLDVRIVISIAAQGDLAATLIEGARLSAITARLRDRGELRLTPGTDLTIDISAGRSHFSMPTLQPDTWPNIATANMPSRFIIAGKDLARMCTALAPAISTEASRYYLCGIFLSAGRVRDAKANDCLLGVATDGHKAYARHMPVEDMPAKMTPIIVPSFTCATVAKLFGEAEEVAVRCGAAKIEFIADDLEYTSKLIEGTFPDWRRVMPMTAAQLSYDAKRLAEAAETAIAGRAVDKSGKAVKLSFGAGETTLSSLDANTGATGSDICQHSQLDQPTLTQIGVNGNYLAEMIDALDGETVEIALPVTENGGPMTLTAATYDDRIVCIMPMRVA